MILPNVPEEVGRNSLRSPAYAEVPMAAYVKTAILKYSCSRFTLEGPGRVPDLIGVIVANARLRTACAAQDSEGQTTVDRDDGVQLPVVQKHVFESGNAQVRCEIRSRKIQPAGLVEVRWTTRAVQIERIGRPGIVFGGVGGVLDGFRPNITRQQRQALGGALGDIDLQRMENGVLVGRGDFHCGVAGIQTARVLLGDRCPGPNTPD